MNFLEEYIKENGIVVNTEYLNVGAFLNQQVDIELMQKVGEEFKRRFSDVKVDKILTAEVSGIAIASVVAHYFDDCKVVIARKAKSAITEEENMLTATVKSFTHGNEAELYVPKKFLTEEDNILIIDDFLAKGEALKGLISIAEKSKCKVNGIGITIEKGFQGGGDFIRSNYSYRLESIAIVESMNPDSKEIIFR